MLRDVRVVTHCYHILRGHGHEPVHVTGAHVVVLLGLRAIALLVGLGVDDAISGTEAHVLIITR